MAGTAPRIVEDDWRFGAEEDVSAGEDVVREEAGRRWTEANLSRSVSRRRLNTNLFRASG